MRRVEGLSVDRDAAGDDRGFDVDEDCDELMGIVF
jgi:hypothetical protein